MKRSGEVLAMLLVMVLLGGAIVLTIAQVKWIGKGEVREIVGQPSISLSWGDKLITSGPVNVKAISTTKFSLVPDIGNAVEAQPDLDAQGEWASPQYKITSTVLQAGRWEVSADSSVEIVLMSDEATTYRVEGDSSAMWFAVGCAWFFAALFSFLGLVKVFNW